MAGIMGGMSPAFNGAKLPEQGFQAQMPFYARQEARNIGHSGGINSGVGGRTDHLPISAQKGAYVMPADVVSALGQGNSRAGTGVLDRMFKSGPYGVGLSRGRSGGLRSPIAPPAPAKYADGGAVPIMAAGGEYVVDPETVASVGGGDIDHGHAILDQFVTQTRADNINTLKSLPGPQR